MRRYRVFAFGVLALGLSACTAPTMTRPTLCEHVRGSVRAGSLPLDLARSFYPECAPFEVRP